MVIQMHKCKGLVYDEEYIDKEKMQKAVSFYEHCFAK